MANFLIMETFATILGYLAVTTIIIGVGLKDDSKVRLLNFFGVCLWLLHFLAISAWSSAVAISISVLMLGASVAGLRMLEKPLVASNAGLVLSYFAMIQMGSAQWIDLLPAGGSFLMNIGVVLLSGTAMTSLLSTGTVAWLAFGILTANPFVIVANALGLCSLTWRAFGSHAIALLRAQPRTSSMG